MRKTRKVRGTTLVELLGVIAVILIIAGIATGSALSAQNKARRSSALTALTSYADAFTSAVTMYPGLVGERASVWVDSTSYSSADGLKKIVASMNTFLDDSLDLYWDPSLKCYTSMGEDPWGDPYMLTEYPVLTGSVDYFDPTVPGNEGRACLSVWCLGGTSSILVDGVISDNGYGVATMFYGGIVDTTWQNLNDSTEFNGYTLKQQ